MFSYSTSRLSAILTCDIIHIHVNIKCLQDECVNSTPTHFHGHIPLRIYEFDDRTKMVECRDSEFIADDGNQLTEPSCTRCSICHRSMPVTRRRSLPQVPKIHHQGCLFLQIIALSIRFPARCLRAPTRGGHCRALASLTNHQLIAEAHINRSTSHPNDP